MIYAALILFGVAMTGWGLFWRVQAEDLLDENFALRFGDPDSTLGDPGAEGPTPTPVVTPMAEGGIVLGPRPVVVSPLADGGMDDLLLEVLIPAQRRPGGAS